MQPDKTLHFTSHIEISTNKLWGAHFMVPEVIARVFIKDDDRRVVCVLNEKVEYQCALLPRGEGSFLITVNKKNRDKLGLKNGSLIHVSLRKDESEYGLPMPEEFAEVLAQDEDGNRMFHALTSGKLRTLLYIVGQVKDPDKRVGRAIAILEHLKKNSGKINYRQLNEDMRQG